MMSREPESGMQKVAAGDMRAALCSAHVAAGRTLVRRTQRRVKARCDQMEERRKQVRQRIGLALLASSAILLLLTPALWGSYSQSAGWRHFADADLQVMYWTAWLLPITLITLVIAFLRAHTQRPERKRLHLMR
jgi:hypothetical protein